MVNVNKIVRERKERLINGNKDFLNIIEIIFMDKKNNFVVEGARTITYGEAYEDILNTAYSINQLYPEIVDQYVGISLDSSYNWIRIFFSILLSGNKPFLINLRHPKNITNELLDELDVKFVIGSDYGFNKKLIETEELSLIRDANYKPKSGSELALSTSLTTGKKKIVIYNAEEISEQILNCDFILKQNRWISKHYKNELRLLMFLPLYHIFGLIASFLWFAFFGRTFVFLPDYNAHTILKTIKEKRVTHIFAVPLFWHLIEKNILKEVEKQNMLEKFNKGLDISYKLQRKFPNIGPKISRLMMRKINNQLFGKSVKFLISGGGYIKPSTLRLINMLGYPLYNGYGSTEIGITSVCLSKDIDKRIDGNVGKKFPSIDYKLENNILKVGGKSISHQMIVDGIHYDVNDYFITNDIVKEKDEYYYLDGRVDDIFIGPEGENISPDMLEKELSFNSNNNYSLLEVNGNLALVMQVSPYLTKDNLKNIYDDILTNLSKLDSTYRVDKIYFTYDKIMNDNAIKVSRKLLRDNIKDGSVELFVFADLKDDEKDLAYNKKICDKVIQIFKDISEKEDVNINTNFFYDLGMTSLEYYELISTLNKEFNVEISFSMNNLDTPLNITNYLSEVLS